MTDQPVKFLLSESDIPAQWVNLLVDLPGEPLPPLNPQTLEPAGPSDLTPIFPMALIEQEVSAEAEIAIPEAPGEMAPGVMAPAEMPAGPSPRAAAE